PRAAATRKASAWLPPTLPAGSGDPAARLATPDRTTARMVGSAPAGGDRPAQRACAAKAVSAFATRHPARTAAARRMEPARSGPTRAIAAPTGATARFVWAI